MKSIKLLLPSLLLILFLVGCEDDPITPPTPVGPTIDFVQEVGYLNSATTVDAGSEFKVKVTAVDVDNPLNFLTIYENGVKLDLTRIKRDGNDVVGNAILLVGDEKSGVTLDLTITAHENAGLSNYSFEITDDGNLTDQVSLDITVEDKPSTFGFTPNGGGLTMDSQLSPNQLFKVTLSAERGTAPLKHIAIYEDGVLITDLNRIEINDIVPTSNPYILQGTAVDSFNWELFIRAHMSGTKAYNFEIADANDEVMSVGFNINTATSIQTEKLVLLLNAGGGDSTGAVNFLSGLSLNSSDSTAHLVDQGIDLSLPNDRNWMQMIQAGQDATLKSVGTSQPEGFNFESVTTKDQIIAAFDLGVLVGITGVTEGELYLLEKNGIYFLIEVSKINATTDNNDDFYELNIKY
jgi:hypothetical protein